MKISEIIKKEMAKSGGSARVVKVPPERRPTAESLKKLDTEISAQIKANDDIRFRSFINACK